jgi:hypothetical protein
MAIAISEDVHARALLATMRLLRRLAEYSVGFARPELDLGPIFVRRRTPVTPQPHSPSDMFVADESVRAAAVEAREPGSAQPWIGDRIVVPGPFKKPHSRRPHFTVGATGKQQREPRNWT